MNTRGTRRGSRSVTRRASLAGGAAVLGGGLAAACGPFGGGGGQPGAVSQEPAWLLLKFLQSDAWLEPVISVAGYQPARRSWLDKYPTLMKQAYPGLADKNLASLTDGQKKDYSRPNELWKNHAECKKLFNDTLSAVFNRNEQPVTDAFRSLAQQINGINRA